MKDGYRDTLVKMSIESMKQRIISIANKIGRENENVEKLEEELP
jgi:hypothetical protein